jgi:hypothetical protein
VQVGHTSAENVVITRHTAETDADSKHSSDSDVSPKQAKGPKHAKGPNSGSEGFSGSKLAGMSDVLQGESAMVADATTRVATHEGHEASDGGRKHKCQFEADVSRHGRAIHPSQDASTSEKCCQICISMMKASSAASRCVAWSFNKQTGVCYPLAATESGYGSTENRTPDLCCDSGVLPSSDSKRWDKEKPSKSKRNSGESKSKPGKSKSKASVASAHAWSMTDKGE